MLNDALLRAGQTLNDYARSDRGIIAATVQTMLASELAKLSGPQPTNVQAPATPATPKTAGGSGASSPKEQSKPKDAGIQGSRGSQVDTGLGGGGSSILEKALAELLGQPEDDDPAVRRLKNQAIKERLRREAAVEKRKSQKMLAELQYEEKTEVMRRRLRELGIVAPEGASYEEMKRLLVQYRRDKTRENPGKGLTEDQKRAMSESVRRVEGPKRGSLVEYEKGRTAAKRKKAADALTGGDTRTLDYIDTENMPADVYRESLKNRKIQDAEARGIARFARKHQEG